MIKDRIPELIAVSCMTLFAVMMAVNAYLIQHGGM